MSGRNRPRRMGEHVKRTVVLAGLLSVSAFGCSSDSYGREDAIKDLKEKGGLSQDQAECVVDDLEKEFGVEKLKSDADPTDEEMAKITEITMGCMGLGGDTEG